MEILTSRNGCLAVGLIALVWSALTVSSLAIEPRVAGLNELVITHPGTHERGLPAVNFELIGDALEVDIPPTVHTHRFYYSGDKEFQGPILQGGPTVVVANHPLTGEKVYTHVTLPAGAPIIAHSKSAITYIFPDQRVKVRFHRFNTAKVSLKYHSGRGIWRQTVDCSQQVASKMKECVTNSPTVQAGKEAGIAGGSVLTGVKQAADKTVASVIDKAKSLTAIIPGATALVSMGRDRDQRNYENQIRQATRQKDRVKPKFITTNR